MYTQEQYQSMAKITKGYVDACGDDKDSLMAMREIAEGLADVYAKDNQQFDRAKFMLECGLRTA